MERVPWLQQELWRGALGSRCCGGPGERGWELGPDDDVTGEVGLRDFIKKYR